MLLKDQTGEWEQGIGNTGKKREIWRWRDFFSLRSGRRNENEKEKGKKVDRKAIKAQRATSRNNDYSIMGRNQRREKQKEEKGKEGNIIRWRELYLTD